MSPVEYESAGLWSQIPWKECIAMHQSFTPFPVPAQTKKPPLTRSNDQCERGLCFPAGLGASGQLAFNARGMWQGLGE